MKVSIPNFLKLSRPTTCSSMKGLRPTRTTSSVNREKDLHIVISKPKGASGLMPSTFEQSMSISLMLPKPIMNQNKSQLNHIHWDLHCLWHTWSLLWARLEDNILANWNLEFCYLLYFPSISNSWCFIITHTFEFVCRRLQAIRGEGLHSRLPGESIGAVWLAGSVVYGYIYCRGWGKSGGI